MTSDKTFFVKEDNFFIGTPAARGPWSELHCHAGPVTGLIAREAEHLVGSSKQLTRLSANFMRPLPLDGIRLEGNVTRDGRQLATSTVSVFDRSNNLCAIGSCVHLATGQLSNLPTAQIQKVDFENSKPGRFPSIAKIHDEEYFADYIEVSFPEGENNEPGPTTLMIKAPGLILNEPPSPFQTLCPLADCGNGISRNGEISEFRFMNPDITIAMHRCPESEWLASDAISFWETTGIGLAKATIFDDKGPVASVLQTLLIADHRNQQKNK